MAARHAAPLPFLTETLIEFKRGSIAACPVCGAVAAGRPYRRDSVGLIRALHGVRNAFMLDAQNLASRGAASGAEALIGAPDEIAGRIAACRDKGVDYIPMLDVSGSRAALPRLSGDAGAATGQTQTAIS